MKNKRSAVKWAVRWMAIGMLFVFAIFVLLLFLLTLSPGEKIIQGIAETKLRNLLGQEVQIGSLETNLFSRLQIQDLQIYQVESGDTIRLLNLGLAKIEFRLVDLLWRRLSIRSLDLNELYLSVNRDSSGALNIPMFAPSEPEDSVSSGPPLKIELEKVTLSRATIWYFDNLIPTNASLHNLSFTAELQRNQTYSYHVHVDFGKAEYLDIPLTVDSIQLAGHWSPQELELDSVSMILPGLKLSGHARLMQKAKPPSVEGDLSLKGDPGKLVQVAREHFTDKLPAVQGHVDLAVQVKGSLDQPRLALQLDFPELSIAEIPVGPGLIRAELQRDLVDMEQLSLQIFGGRISGKAKVSADSLFAYQASIWVEEIDLAQIWRSIYRQASPYQGKINGTLTAFGQTREPKDWIISSDLNLMQLRYHSKFLPDFSTKLTFKKGVANFSFRQQNSEMSATVKLDDDKLEGLFSARIHQLGPLAGLFDIHQLSGGIEIQGLVGGKLDSPEIRAQIKGEKIAYQDLPVDTLGLNILYRGGVVHISDLYFAGDLDPIDTLSPTFGLSNIGGRIRYQGFASGTADSLNGGVVINLVQPSYGDIRFDDGWLRIALDNQRISLSSLQLRRDSLLIQATGEFDILSAKGSCGIDLLHVGPEGYNLTDTMFNRFQELDDSQPDVDRIGKLKATFDLLEANWFSLQLDGDQLNLEKIRTLLPESPDISGLLRFGLDFSGNLEDPRVEVDFQLHKPGFQSVEMDSLRGHFSLDNDQFKVKHLELYAGDHHSWATLVVGLEKSKTGGYLVSGKSLLQGQARGSDFDLGLLSPLLSEEMRLTGSASYDLSWDGTFASPHPVGTLSVRDGMIQSEPNMPAIQQINLTLSMEDSVLNIKRVTGIIRETPFHLYGEITTSQWQRFNLQMNFSISDFATVVGNGMISQDSIEFNARIKKMDLSLFQPFFPDLKQLSGTLNTEVTLNGSTTDPQLDGHLEISELTVQPSWLNTPFSEGIIKLDFNQKEVKVDSFFIRMNEGTIFLFGNLTHQRGGLESANFQTIINNIKIHRPKEIILVIHSAKLSYKNQNNYYLLDGDIILGESRVLANFRPQSILPFAQAVERPKQELPPFFQQTRINVRLRESENLWVDNNLARLRLHTELGFIGSPVQPNLTGRVTAEEGYLLYLDRKFRIKQGVVDFVDPDHLNPIIDFKAQANVTSYRATEATPYIITLAITGPLDEVVVELTSDPPLDKSNILSLLTIGATRDQLAGKDAEGKDASISAVLKERAQSISSQRIAGYTSRKVGTLLGLEQFTIEGNLFSFDRSWGPQLLASKKISPRVEITYTTTVGHSNENRFRLDYRLSKHFSLEGETDQQGRAGMNLKYRLRSK